MRDCPSEITVAGAVLNALAHQVNGAPLLLKGWTVALEALEHQRQNRRQPCICPLRMAMLGLRIIMHAKRMGIAGIADAGSVVAPAACSAMRSARRPRATGLNRHRVQPVDVLLLAAGVCHGLDGPDSAQARRFGWVLAAWPP